MRHLFEGVKALGDQSAQRQPAPFEVADHIGDGGERTFNNGAGLIGDAAGQGDGNGTAQGVTEDVARLVGVLGGQPVPRGAGVLQRQGLGGMGGVTLAKATVVYGQYRKSECLHAPNPLR